MCMARHRISSSTDSEPLWRHLCKNAPQRKWASIWTPAFLNHDTSALFFLIGCVIYQSYHTSNGAIRFTKDTESLLLVQASSQIDPPVTCSRSRDVKQTQKHSRKRRLKTHTIQEWTTATYKQTTLKQVWLWCVSQKWDMSVFWRTGTSLHGGRRQGVRENSRLASMERASPDACLADNFVIPACGPCSVDLSDSPDLGASLVKVLGVKGLQRQSSSANWSFDEVCPKSCFPHRGLHGGLFHVL